MAEASADNRWVVTSSRASTGLFSSLSAFYKVVGHKQIYGPYERPPFPIIVDKPTVSDLVSSWRSSDYFMFGTIYGTGLLWSFVISRPLPLIS